MVLRGFRFFQWQPRPRFSSFRAAGRCSHILAGAVNQFRVAALRVRGRRLRGRRDEGIALVDWRLAKAERKEFEQPYASSTLQRILLFTPGFAGAGTGTGWRCITACS